MNGGICGGFVDGGRGGFWLFLRQRWVLWWLLSMAGEFGFVVALLVEIKVGVVAALLTKIETESGF